MVRSTMSHRLTKKELDEQFELFLKESVSDESVDLGSADSKPNDQSTQKSAQKPVVSWWKDDNRSSRGAGRVASADPFYKPVPQPRSKALEKPAHLDETHKEKVSQRHRTPFADSRSDTLNSLENLRYVSGNGSLDVSRCKATSPASTDSLSQGDSEDELLGSGKIFRKSLRKSQSIQEELGDSDLKKEGKETAAGIRDLPELEDSKVLAASMTNMGLETLEEEEEKARFFAQLEEGASTTIDYSKLNRELDSSSTLGANRSKSEEAVEQNDDDQRGAKVTETPRESSGSPHYSEDFTEEENGKEQLEEKAKVSQILAKVSFYDSLDDTGEEDRRKDTAGSLDTHIGAIKSPAYVQSGGSEMEALREAYRQIHVVDDSEGGSSLKGRGMSRPESLPSSPQHPRQSLQPTSTNESELPTAEELMRLIQPESDHIRGFSLQPVSAVELDQGTTSHFLEGTFPEVTSSESQLKRHEEAEPAAHIKEARRPSSSNRPNHNMTWSIREEVERLMQDDFKYSSQAPKANTQQASHGSTFSHPSTSSVRKPTVAPVRGRKMEGRTAVTSGRSRAAATARTRPPASCPMQRPQEKPKVARSKEKHDLAEPGVKVSSELVSSVQSLVAVLQQQIDTAGRHGAADAQEARVAHHLPEDNREESTSLVEELRLQLAYKERELQVMREGAEELNALRQQNYLLQSKLRRAEEANQKTRLAEAADSHTKESLQQIDKEIKEQETLIKGYQQENERLYLQLKAQQAKSKANEEDMFNENQRLLSELAFTREQLKKSSKSTGNVCLMDHTQRITDLLAQINTFQRNETKMSEDIRRVKQEKQALEADLQLMKKERDLAKARATSASGDKSFEMRVLEDKHREEVAALKKKLQWFAENQELLDRDAGRLKAATTEIHQLKEQVEKLRLDVSKRGSEQQRKVKDKTVEAKRMQDLERQVKELEQILRRRNPNSLPALIYAAATANSRDTDADAAETSPPSRINALLERRIQRLEAELESHDDEAKRSLRAMEQQFHRIKLRYEQQISELEQQLEQKRQPQAASSPAAESGPQTSRVETLEEELRRAKKTHQEKEKSLQEQIESLQQHLKHKAHSSPGRHQRQAEAAFGVRVDRLNQELSAKTRSIQELSRTVERLQKERRNVLFFPYPQPETRRQPGPAKTHCSAAAAGETCGGEEVFPAAQYEKTYQPNVFTGSHITEVLQENDALKRRLESLELRSEQEREALKADAAHAGEELRRLQEHSAEQLSSMKAEHLGALDQLRATHALEHSSSKVAELANKLSTQEMTVTLLQEQLKELQGTKDALAISRTREDALQKQLTKLLKDLKEVKDAQSPEVKLLCNLERKIINMELRHQHREKELQQVIGGSWQALDPDQQSQVERWKHLAQDKSRELEAFRLELDSILDILRHLQRQGVVLPLTVPQLPLTQRS